MAIYHNNITVINRSSSRSSVSSSAYISGTKIKNERDGLVHDYTRKKGVVYSEIMLCENAPNEWNDSWKLWNAVEKIENGNGQSCRIIEVALPKELDTKENIELAREYVRETFVRKGMCAEFAIHDKKDENPHAHIMVTMRPVNEDGKWENKTEKVYICKNHQGEEKEFTAKELKRMDSEEWEKQLPYYKNGNVKSKPVYLSKYEKEHEEKYKTYERVKGKNDPKKSKKDRINTKVAEWNSEKAFCEYRKNLEIVTNKHLEKKHLEIRIDHRSFKEQGIERQPTIHEGVAARQIQKRGEKSYMIEKNKRIKEENKLLEKINSEIAQLERMKEQKLMELNKESENIEKENTLFKEKELEKEHKGKDNSILTFEEESKIEIKHRDSHKELAESREERGSVTRLEGEANSIADLQNNYIKIQAIENKRQADIKELKNINLDIEKHEKNIEELKKQRESAKGIMKASLRKSLDKDIAEKERIIKLKEQHLRDKHQIHNREQLNNRIKDLSNESSNRQEERISISQKLQQLKKQQEKDNLKETRKDRFQERTR